MRPHLICSAVLAVAGLTACAHQGEQSTAVHHAAGQDNTHLTAYHWELDRAVDAAGTPDPRWVWQSGDNKRVTLTFDKERLAVDGLCNNMGAHYQVEGPKIHIDQIVSTMRMCPDQSLMRYEQAFGQRLPQASMWHITRMDNEPVQQPSLTLRFEDGAQWVLNGVPTPETKYGSTGETLFLEVHAQTVACSDPLIPNRQCLNVRTIDYGSDGLKQGHGPWQPFYGYIEGYQHTPGMRNVLRVKRYTRQNPPADTSEYAYVLDMVVESEMN